jgi:hypothetical protein
MRVKGRGRRLTPWTAAVFMMVFVSVAGHETESGAFAPTKLLGLGSNTHQSITEASITALDTEFFAVPRQTRTMRQAMGQIVDANVAVDDDQVASALHFDGENFAAGQTRITGLLNRTIADLKAKNAQAARADLGGALHTIQDFYAHSNWIELGNNGPNADLGRSGHTIGNVAGPTEATCNGSTLTTTKLTSGYYGGEDRAAPIPTKCRHGGPFDHGPGTGGINKDLRLSTLSPHSTFHGAAAGAARQATDQFVRDIKGQVTAPQLRLLLGAGPTLGVAIDTTGSMGSIIEGVKSQATQIVDGRLGKDEEPSKYVLAPFNDPGTGPIVATDSANDFKAAIGSLSASGGDDCPELSMTGMLGALPEMDKGGDLFMFTDASSKDAGLAGNVSSIASSNEVSVYPVLFGSCSPIDPAYVRVANDTGGQVFVLSPAEAGQITKLADFVVRANAIDLLAVAGNLSTGPQTFAAPVDSTMTSVTFSTSGANDMTVKRPDGTAVQPGDPGVQAISLNGGLVPARIITVASPVVGTWSVALTGPESFSMKVTGESSLDLSNFRFLHQVPGHGGPFLVPIIGFPVTDHATTVDAVLEGPFQAATFDLRKADGTPLQTLDLTPVGDPPDGEFSGDITPPTTAFRVYVTGKDHDGNTFQRTLPSTIRPQAIVITSPASSELRPGHMSTFAFKVQNLGSSDTFRVSVSDNKGFVRSFSPNTLAIDKNATATIMVEVQPPETATDGMSDTLSVDVASTTNPDVHNFAVLTNPVVAIAPAGPPSVSITTPADGATYRLNQVIKASYSCTDDPNGPGIASCTGTVTHGSPIDTKSTGSHTFAVSATSTNGQSASKTVHYTVLGPPVNCLTAGTHRISGKVRRSLAISGPGNWCVQSAHIKGSIRITDGANVLIERATVSGMITAHRGGVFALCGSSVRNAVEVSDATAFVLIGDPADDRCASNWLRDTVHLDRNHGGVEVSQNRINDDLKVNRTTGDGANHGGIPEDHGSEIEGNTVRGAISCSANTPPPSNDGHPNHARDRRGQCATPGF